MNMGINKKTKKKKAIVAMSGGVDSSVAAAILKEQGYEVIGVFFKLQSGFNPATRLSARQLGIKFFVLDCRKDFKKKVIERCLKVQKAGFTPNPCVVCNKEIKFAFLFKQLKKLKADYVATGHYARVKDCRLLKGKDKNKDQSYFLWKLKQKQLAKILFPIGDYTKPQVRALAKRYGLSDLISPESQDICFKFDKPSLSTSLSRCLSRFDGKTRPGLVITRPGLVLGEHRGLDFYTIGQRKDIRLAGGPYYVIKKDLKNNTLIVSKNKKDLESRKLVVRDINWISSKPEFPLKTEVKIRYGHKPAKAVVFRRGNGLKIVFDRPQSAITPGQSAVFYQGNRLLGGGIIA